ncbi:hypothetical protein C7Y69_10720 [Alteromonas sp. KS69]|nr:hypothetical protein C7Y69_10720 [Alteromonas sp. KS69]
MYMQARYYEPVIGRFYSNDLVGYTGEVDTFNRYFYVANNLFKYTDPNGEEKYYRQVKVTPYGIASEFQRRRKKWILISIVCSCVFLPLLFTLDSFEGQRLSIGITVFTLSLIAWVVFTLTSLYLPEMRYCAIYNSCSGRSCIKSRQLPPMQSNFKAGELIKRNIKRLRQFKQNLIINPKPRTLK